MDNVLEQLITVPNLVFCIIIAVAVQIQHKIINKIWKGAKSSKSYQEFWLPIGPIGTGAILAALIVNYPYPEIFADSFWARTFWGVICGLASAHVFRIAKKFLVNKDKNNLLKE